MAKQAVVVTYRVRPGQMEAFLPILKLHVRRTKATEAGCLQFDILIPHSEADTVRLHEVYADEAALRGAGSLQGGVGALPAGAIDKLVLRRRVTDDDILVLQRPPSGS